MEQSDQRLFAFQDATALRVHDHFCFPNFQLSYLVTSPSIPAPLLSSSLPDGEIN